MLPLVGCVASTLAVTLPQKPNLDGTKGFCTKFVGRTRAFLGCPYEKLALPFI